MVEIKWRAKKKNMERRVDAYSHPGVDQVIYRGEWQKHKTWDKADISPSQLQLLRLIIAIIFILVIIWVVW